MLVDMKISGASRKVLAQANRNGFFYVLDRANGKLLAANPYVKVNWADRDRHGHRQAGGVRGDEEACATVNDVEIWPSVLGGKNWTPMSWNPTTGLAYANTLNMSWPYQIAKQELQAAASGTSASNYARRHDAEERAARLPVRRSTR